MRYPNDGQVVKSKNTGQIGIFFRYKARMARIKDANGTVLETGYPKDFEIVEEKK